MKVSAGLLMYKFDKKGKEGRDFLKVFLVHHGGPYWKNKDERAWSIPKGLVNEGESLLDAAKREFEEETGIKIKLPLISLGSVKQKSGKEVHSWAFEGDWTGFLMKQSMIEIEFPYKSGKKIKVPEVDKAGFFPISVAKKKIILAQAEFIDRLVKKLNC